MLTLETPIWGCQYTECQDWRDKLELHRRTSIRNPIMMLLLLLAMPTLPLLLLAPTMLTMELTLVDMELLAGTLTTQSCWLDTKQPIIEKILLKKMCQNLLSQWLVATEKILPIGKA